MPLSAPLVSTADAPLRLVVIGGRLEDDNQAIYGEMRRLSQGRILIFPTASSEPELVGAETQAAFANHGFDAAVAPVWAANAAQSSFDPAVVAMVADYGSVYFTGGDQALIRSALIVEKGETPVLKAIRAALRSGGMLAGSSAGAAIMSREMILGGTSFEAMAHGVSRDPAVPGVLVGEGLGFFPHGLIDQHFIKRGRLARLVVAMAHVGQVRGFGIDENTALVVEGQSARVCGEYGVFFVDLTQARVETETRSYEGIRLSYLDDGDSMDFLTFRPKPGEAKRRVRNSEIAYRAPARSRRNAFGAYALYDLVARMVLSDQKAYWADTLRSNDVRSGLSAQVEVRRIKGKSRCLISTPDEGLRISAINLNAALKSQPLQTDASVEQFSRSNARTFGMDLNERSRIILLGSSPLAACAAIQREIAGLIEGPVGVFAAASAEAHRTAQQHIAFLARHGIAGIDLGVTIDTVDYAAKNEAMLDRIASMKSIYLCGGNQIRLVETLLHRGEESAVLQAIATAYANGATLIASGGAAAAVAGVMIAGGSSLEALRYGVASDPGHQGLLIQEGVGLFASAITDQNIISERRLGRLVVACVEENERFGIGVCEESAVIAQKSSVELRAAGRHGFIQVETDPVKAAAVDDRFIARGVRLRMFGPGDRVNLNTGRAYRQAEPAAVRATLDRLLADLTEDCGVLHVAERTGRDPGARHAVKVRVQREDEVTALLDLECAREEHD